MRRLLLAACAAFGLAAPALAEDTLNPPRWQSQGTFGSYDTAALQRGFLVYQSVCASCHSMSALHYRDLAALGFTTDQVAALASNVKLANGAPATLDDPLKNPYPDPASAAAAFGGAVPPDLSNIVNARPKGLLYVFRVLTGYRDAPPEVTVLPQHYYNIGIPGQQIAMPPPLKDGQVSYADGTRATTAQEASDVTAFLAWAADPNLDTRREVGLRVVLFLVFLTILAVATKRKIWREAV